MEPILKIVLRLSRWSSVIGEVMLTFMMLLTVCDVILRSFRMPLVGTYELVSFSGAAAIGFSVPITSWMRGHVNVDLFTARLSKQMKTVFDVGTRCLVIAFFLLLSWRMMKYGIDLHRAKEVSMTLQMPFYPVVYGLAIAFFIQVLVLLCDILKIHGGTYE